MRLTTIGTGTAAPHARRAQAGALLESGNVRLLVDCGSGVVLRMAELGLPWASLTHVAITHFHADHTNDLANLIYAWRYGLLPPRGEPVEIIGPPGLEALIGAMRAAFGSGLLDVPPPIRIVEVAPGEVQRLAPDVDLELDGIFNSENVARAIVQKVERRVKRGGFA
jgi:ribonuclease Z